MKIFICCSKHLYSKVLPVKRQLEELGHRVSLPNSFYKPLKEEDTKEVGDKEHRKWKRRMIHKSHKRTLDNDAILVLNFNKKRQRNYIGGATFLEIFTAFNSKKKVFLYNPIPVGILEDELRAMITEVIEGDLSKIK